jgi:phosphatidylglycerol---prolipoprotein diacylglyceryl transferase
MTFQSPGTEIFTIGPVTLRWYGVLIATGFYLALNYASSLIQNRSHSKYKSIEDFQNFAFFALFGGIIGARLWFVILDWDYFSQNLIEAPQIWLGGISIQGGLIGGVITAFLMCIKDLKKLLFYLSALASAIPLAQAIGRWGNFFNEEAFGKVCDLPWKLFISHTGKFHHPTFLYESILNLGIFVILFFYNKYFYQNGTKHDLRLIGLYFFFYSFIRFFLESIRTDSLLIGGYPAAQALAITGILIGLILVGVSVSRES